jgi:hypothetical protein
MDYVSHAKDAILAKTINDLELESYALESVVHDGSEMLKENIHTRGKNLNLEDWGSHRLKHLRG